jgi:hypothetical protein
MKTAVAFLALAGAANAFVPASTSSSKNGLQAVFDDYVGNFDFMGKELNFDPVSTIRPRLFNPKMTKAQSVISSLCFFIAENVVFSDLA